MPMPAREHKVGADPVAEFLKEVSSLVDAASLEGNDRPLQIRLPTGRTPKESEHLKKLWAQLKILLEDEESRPQLKAMLKRLQEKQQQRQPPPPPEPEVPPEIAGFAPQARDTLQDFRAEMPTLAEDQVVAIQSELFDRYSNPKFQTKLFSVYCGNDPRSKAYNEKLTALVRSARSDVLAKYNFPPGQKGDTALALLLSEFRTNSDIQALDASIDELFYSGEAPMVEGSSSLSKRDILKMCRDQMASFRKPEFQEKLRCLKAGSMRRRSSTESAGGTRAAREPTYFWLEGRGELALEEQRPILKQYGLEPNERGAHSLLHQFAKFIMDPEVATCGAAINVLLGMEEPARVKFTERLRTISVEDPCQKAVQKKEELFVPDDAPVYEGRRHSTGTAQAPRRPSLQRELEEEGLLPPSQPRRRSVAEAAQAQGAWSHLFSPPKSGLSPFKSGLPFKSSDVAAARFAPPRRLSFQRQISEQEALDEFGEDGARDAVRNVAAARAAMRGRRRSI